MKSYLIAVSCLYNGTRSIGSTLRFAFCVLPSGTNLSDPTQAVHCKPSAVSLIHIIAPLVFLVSVSVCGAQPISDKERRYVIGLLETSSKNFLTSIDGVTEEQWLFKPCSDCWSVGEISEHIALAEDLLFSITQKTLKTPPESSKSKTLEGREQFVLERIADRSDKSQAPEVIRPAGKFSSKQAILAAFQDSRNKTIAYLRTTSDPLKNHVATHPFVGDMTVYQWFVFIAGHANRHVAQLQEVKEHAKYPKP